MSILIQVLRNILRDFVANATLSVYDTRIKDTATHVVKAIKAQQKQIKEDYNEQ